MSDLLTECVCKHPGLDDGESTCWVHHDCSDGTCTHAEEDEPETLMEDYYD